MHSLPVVAADAGAPSPTPPLSRRGFVTSCALAALGASSSSSGGDPASPGGPPPAGAGFADDVLTVPLASVRALAAASGFFVTNPGAGGGVRDAAGRAADIIVLNLGNDTYRAFTSVCTHERCTVASLAAGRMICPCHGSQYDSAGRVLSGPATRALAEYATTFDAATRTVTVRKR